MTHYHLKFIRQIFQTIDSLEKNESFTLLRNSPDIGKSTSRLNSQKKNSQKASDCDTKLYRVGPDHGL